MVDPVSIGSAVVTVASWASSLFGGGSSLNRQQRRALRAGVAAGYQPAGRAGYRAPSGQLVGRRTVIQAGRAALAQQPAAPNIAIPSGMAETVFASAIPSILRSADAAARRRRGSGPGYRPAYWKRLRDKYRTYWECVEGEGGATDTNVENCAYVFGLPNNARGPLPPLLPPSTRRPVPTRPPPLPPEVSRRVLTSARVLGRILGPVGWIFWPSETADDDFNLPDLEPAMDPVRQPPKGPGRRPVIAPPPPRVRPEPPWPVYQPRFPGDFDLPQPGTPPIQQPARPPDPVQLPIPTPTRVPTRVPGRTPLPRIPGTRPGLPSWLPYLPAVLPRPPASPSRAARPDRLPDLTPFQQPGLPYAAPQLRPASRECPPCERTKQRRKKREPRAVCYSGTYRERSRGLSKSRKRKIPCR